MNSAKVLITKYILAHQDKFHACEVGHALYCDTSPDFYFLKFTNVNYYSIHKETGTIRGQVRGGSPYSPEKIFCPINAFVFKLLTT